MALMEEFFPGKSENLPRLPHPHDRRYPTPSNPILIEDPSPVGPFGAKGIGEQAVIPTRSRHPERHSPRDWSPHPPRPSHADRVREAIVNARREADSRV